MEYVIICKDQLSFQKSFLFWKSEGKGYTANIDGAGIWKEKPENIQDFIISKELLLKEFKTCNIMEGSLWRLEKFVEGK